MFDISEELKKIPANPGVYIHHDERDEIIYIGKAKNLKNRVSQYFRKGVKRSPKIEKMVSQIARFEYIITDSETEALILENNLIKENRPRYNTMLKDDKTYPYIRVTVSEDFPRLYVTRNIKKDHDKYYGPYPNVTAVRQTLDFLNNVYQLRTCRRKLPQEIGKARPCLNHHIHKCDAPCAGLISKEDYGKKIDAAKRFLEGNSKEVVSYIKDKMMEASAAMEYEQAGRWKELLEFAKYTADTQKMETKPGEDRDVLGLAAEGFEAVMQVFFIRGGKLIDREHFYLTTAPEETETEIVSSFIKQYYGGTPFLPGEILLPCAIEDEAAIHNWLSEKAGRKVQLVTPQKGKKEKMVELAAGNAKLLLDLDKDKMRREELKTRGAVSDISAVLGIPYAKRIESYDISNISGYLSVGSMVVFEDGSPKKNDYRKFRIKTVIGPNDYASMAEVLTRRFEHEEWTRPDLILIDGGEGQVNAVLKAFEESAEDASFSLPPVAGMVKDDRHRTRGMIFEGREYIMERAGEAFKLLTRIQDETHRFAIEYHRQLRSKGQVHSVLDDIPGIGPKRRLSLMRYFKTIEAVKAATEEELAKAPEMNAKAARAVVEFFKEK